MRRKSLGSMDVPELVERFVAISLAQDEALLNDEFGKYNRLYGQMDLVRKELKSRDGDQRIAFHQLFAHPNAQVRLNAANSTLALVPEEARRVLQKIVDQKEFPQAMSAGSMLSALDEGRYSPS